MLEEDEREKRIDDIVMSMTQLVVAAAARNDEKAKKFLEKQKSRLQELGVNIGPEQRSLPAREVSQEQQSANALINAIRADPYIRGLTRDLIPKRRLESLESMRAKRNSLGRGIIPQRTPAPRGRPMPNVR
jgi:hypothetical protein